MITYQVLIDKTSLKVWQNQVSDDGGVYSSTDLDPPSPKNIFSSLLTWMFELQCAE